MWQAGSPLGWKPVANGRLLAEKFGLGSLPLPSLIPTSKAGSGREERLARSLYTAMSNKNPGLYALTPNPALDLSGHVKQIVPNEKNTVRNPRLDPGGNAINAARIAKRLGQEPVLMGFLGGAAGQQLAALLDQEGLRHRFTAIQGITRTNVTVTNDSDCVQTRLSFPGPKISSLEARSLLSSISRLKAPGIFVLGGSFPPGCPRNFASSLIRMADQRGLGVVVDVPSTDLRQILDKKVPRLLLIKPNRVEFESLVGKRLSTDNAIAHAAAEYSHRAAVICVSLGSQGAMISANGKSWKVHPPRVPVNGTVGAGDSMVGAITARLLKQRLTTPLLCDRAPDEAFLDAARWGAAAGAATVATEGTLLGSSALIRKLASKVRLERL
jgi:1-phosphofructokinase family hexose kinase